MKTRNLIQAGLIAASLMAFPMDSVAQMREASRFPIATPSARTIDGPSSYKVHGAIGGLVVGAGATAFVLYTGGSTAPCNRSENQDAMSSGECAAVMAAGGAVGALLGFLIGSQIQRSYRTGLQTAPAAPAARWHDKASAPPLPAGWTMRLDHADAPAPPKFFLAGDGLHVTSGPAAISITSLGK